MTSVFTTFEDGDQVWLCNWEHEKAEPAKKAGKFAPTTKKKEIRKAEPPKVAAIVKGKPSETDINLSLNWGDLCSKCKSRIEQPPNMSINSESKCAVMMMDASNREGRQDMVELADLAVGELMYNLRLRYKSDPMQYYTYVGDILIAVNPLANLKRTGADWMAKYKDQKMGEPTLPPHVFAIGDESYRRMLQRRHHQSVVISGESGAGKSESTKHVLQYLSFVSPKGSAEIDVNSKILATSEVLEAFGNAKTSRNDNSSRFGKFVQIMFNDKNSIVGAKLDQYLLEKSRIVGQEINERNYHVFYMMFRCMTPAELAKYHLTEMKDYKYLIGHKGANIGTVYLNKQGKDIGDEHRFADFIRCMDELGLDAAFRETLWRILAAILLFGQIKFKPTKEGQPCEIVNGEVVTHIAELLAVNRDELGSSLLKYRIGESEPPVFKFLKEQQCYDTADALAKQIYGKLFEILVEEEINDKIRGSGDMDVWIGVLDIFGFESFQEQTPDGFTMTTNKFEQICINLTNEQLQNYFLEKLIPEQEKIYRAEDIDIKGVEYANNAGCLELIKGKNGLLDLLNNMTKFVAKGHEEFMLHPEKADMAWLENVVKEFGKAPEPLEPSDWKEKKEDFFGWWHKQDIKHNKHLTEFFIYHYAGQVWYTVLGAVDRNKDEINPASKAALKTSELPLMKRIAEHGGAGGSTVAAKFTQSLKELKEKLEQTDSMFVRCVKPNCEMKPGGMFEDWKVLEQLISAGMGAIIDMRMAGYPVQRRKGEFVEFFDDLCDDKSQMVKLDIDGKVRYLCDLVFNLNPDACVPKRNKMAPYAVGRTLVFLKDPMFKEMQKARDAALRAKREKMKRGILNLQSVYRMYLAQQELPDLRERAAKVRARLDKKRKLMAMGMSAAEAEAQIAREEEEERAREEEAFRQKTFVPVEKASAKLLEDVPQLISDIDDFGMGTRPRQTEERDDLARRKTLLREKREELTKVMSEFAADYHDKKKKKTAQTVLDALHKIIEDEKVAIVKDRERREMEQSQAEMLKQKEIEKRRAAERKRIYDERKAEQEAKKQAILNELNRAEIAKNKKRLEKAAKREVVYEARRKARAQKEQDMLQRRLEMEKAEKAEKRKEKKERDRVERKTALKDVRTNALKGTVVKFQDMLATVKFVGELPFPASGEYIGIECEKRMGALPGNSGIVMDTKFFECHPGHGLFVRGTMLYVVRPGAVDLHESDRVWRKGSRMTGTVRFVGNTDFGTGQWVGVELDVKGSGKNNGTVKGRKYFKCPDLTGIFVRPDDLAIVMPWTQEFVEEVSNEYGILHNLDSDESDDENLPPVDADELQEQLRDLATEGIIIDESSIIIDTSDLNDLYG